MDKSLDGEITKLIKQGEIKGKLGEVTIIHSLGKFLPVEWQFLVWGRVKELTPDKIRIAIADACRTLRKKGAKQH